MQKSAFVFLGPPGAGKGTQIEKLLGVIGPAALHLSTGNLFRMHMRNKTELGQRVRSIMDAGHLVPDELTVQMVSEQVGISNQPIILFDGFPRTFVQALAFSVMLDEFGIHLAGVPFLQVDKGVLIDRLTSRRTCTDCNHAYNVNGTMPAVDGCCDICGGAVVQRTDDTAAIQEERLAVYEQNTVALLAYFGNQGNLLEINGNGDIEDVFAQLRGLVMPLIPSLV